METNNNPERFEQHGGPMDRANNQGENFSQNPDHENENRAGQKLASDERELANDGDWDNARESVRTDNSETSGDIQSPGGAGSSGSEATNSGTPGSL